MTNWLERARREILGGNVRATAKTAQRNPMALTAVPEPSKSEVSPNSIGSNGSMQSATYSETKAVAPLTDSEECALRAWLSHIEETDEAIIAHVLNHCRTDADARAYFVQHADETRLAVDDGPRQARAC